MQTYLDVKCSAKLRLFCEFLKKGRSAKRAMMPGRYEWLLEGTPLFI